MKRSFCFVPAQVFLMLRGRSVAGFGIPELCITMAVVGVVAVVAVTMAKKMRQDSQRDVCILNLTAIENAKQQWAIENKKTEGARPIEPNILPYMKDQRMPRCPGGGFYRLQRLGRHPHCSLQAEGHLIQGAKPVTEPDPD